MLNEKQFSEMMAELKQLRAAVSDTQRHLLASQYPIQQARAGERISELTHAAFPYNTLRRTPLPVDMPYRIIALGLNGTADASDFNLGFKLYLRDELVFNTRTNEGWTWTPYSGVNTDLAPSSYNADPTTRLATFGRVACFCDSIAVDHYGTNPGATVALVRVYSSKMPI